MAITMFCVVWLLQDWMGCRCSEFFPWLDFASASHPLPPWSHHLTQPNSLSPFHALALSPSLAHCLSVRLSSLKSCCLEARKKERYMSRFWKKSALFASVYLLHPNYIFYETHSVRQKINVGSCVHYFLCEYGS